MKHRISFIAFAVVLGVAAQAFAQEAPAPLALSPATLEAAAKIPVQEGGRVKPLDTFARFTLLQLNARRECKTPEGRQIGAMEWLLQTMLFPEYGQKFQVFLIESPEVMDAIALPHDKPRLRFTYKDIEPHRMQLYTLAQQYSAIEDPQRTPVQRQLINLAHNVHLFETLLNFFSFARASFTTPAGVKDLFGGAETATYAQVLEQGPALLHALVHPGDAIPREQAVDFLKHVEEESAVSDAIAIIPPPSNTDEEWRTPAQMLELALKEQPISKDQLALVSLLGAIERQKSEPVALETGIGELQRTLEKLAGARGEYSKIGTEVLLYKVQPFYWGLVLYVCAFVLLALTWLFPQAKKLARVTLLFTLAPISIHIFGIALRCIIRERPPVTTLYETILFISAVAVTVAIIMEFMNHRRIGLAVAPILGALGLFLANKYEMIDGRDTMPNLIAVLDTNFWLSTHVTTVTIGYSAGMLAGAIAHIYLIGKAVGFRKGDKLFYKNITRMVYGVLCFGILFATLGTVLGGIWANDSWGRFWGWDPKENGALMIVLWGLAVLHARMGGYIRDFGVNMAAVFGAIVVGFSWFGVNLLGVGLHSYGFTSGVKQALTIFYAIEVLVMMVGAVAWMREKVIVQEQFVK